MFVLGGSARSMPMASPKRAPSPAASRSSSSSPSPKSTKSLAMEPSVKPRKAPIGVASVNVQTPTRSSHASANTSSRTQSPRRSSRRDGDMQSWTAPPPTYQQYAPSDLSCVCHGGHRVACEDCVAERNYQLGYQQAIRDSKLEEERRQAKMHTALTRRPRISRASTLASLKEEDEE